MSDPNSAEMMGLAAFVAMSELLNELEKDNPGLKQRVIDSAVSECKRGTGPNFDAIITNLRRI